ncbi:hypothetical protein [Paraburkholderia caribensis]|uniref:hypothetical protein n=1 Tax=Paraburkholderia caribensis TaxID=75105 RepID=UPI000720C1DA|nr:hypothetical protein [Paraburkholderia caribensis]ALP62843.1 hypothetical protein AN416_09695 [Paraburkholderia caribensis]AUT51926.1 hypothetical protein C2L66_08705 [Paraburkholderia caribensis]
MLTYLFFGKVLPERAQLSVSEIRFEMRDATSDVTRVLFVEIIYNQVVARIETDTPLDDHFTAKNAVDDAVRTILDGVGFGMAHAYDLDLVQFADPVSPRKQVFGINIPAASGIADSFGVNFEVIWTVLSAPNGWLVRRALSDMRESIHSAADTAFFIYRAIETLMSGYASANQLPPKSSSTWESFRSRYGLEEQAIKNIKLLADPMRHGRVVEIKGMSDDERSQLFRDGWTMVSKVLRKLYDDFQANGRVAIFA